MPDCACFTQQGRQDSNLQPPVLETGALPIEPRPWVARTSVASGSCSVACSRSCSSRSPLCSALSRSTRSSPAAARSSSGSRPWASHCGWETLRGRRGRGRESRQRRFLASAAYSVAVSVKPGSETQALWQDYRKTRDQALRDRLILTYAPLVKFVAGRLGATLACSRRRAGPRVVRPARPDRRDRAIRSRP